ncbi:ABC transporter substrate-binding protein [Methanoregula formicica]|uniref:ABC-type Fe3+-hydroxamate transport system, periplasmic component n=1 Tax=Methanoregula formicica (strain DSM 22288 / NBRC 105244 / SMSP) TaxID=593750 RepID=L0HF61_METFS|nr:ABC transporter substrate-binding protein [Methanoregula formicica]AGB01958.1 ABC-type Fe3+-hydroxamate transport system, periplasmic component [Methanoregula formicica SMSP]
MSQKSWWTFKQIQRYSLAVILIFICCIVSGCSSSSDEKTSFSQRQSIIGDTSITITDSSGTSHTFNHPVERIICQNGLAAEILVDIGATDQIVGVTDTALKEQYLMNQIPHAKSIGEIRSPDMEKIVALHPDVFIAYGDSGSIPGNIDKIRAANITIIYTKVYDIRDIANETRMLGKITGREANAERLIDFTEKYQSLIESRTENISQSESPRVYLEQLSDYMATHQGSSGDYVLSYVHAQNIAGNISVPYAIVSPEWVIEQNPDIIIKQVTRGKGVSAVRQDIINRAGFSRIRAVQDQRVYAFSSSMLSGAREIIGILYIAKAVHPDRFTDIDPEEVLKEYANTFMTGSDLPGSFDPQLPKTSGNWNQSGGM